MNDGLYSFNFSTATCTEETGLQHKPTLSSIPYEEYVSEFDRLFTDGFDVQDEIAEAVFDIWWVNKCQKCFEYKSMYG